MRLNVEIFSIDQMITPSKWISIKLFVIKLNLLIHTKTFNSKHIHISTILHLTNNNLLQRHCFCYVIKITKTSVSLKYILCQNYMYFTIVLPTKILNVCLGRTLLYYKKNIQTNKIYNTKNYLSYYGLKYPYKLLDFICLVDPSSFFFFIYLMCT